MAHKKSIITLCVTALILGFMPTAANSFWGTVQTDSISAFSKTSDFSDDVHFSSSDFTSKLSKNAELSGIIIDELPDATVGTLKLSGREVFKGEGVSVNGIDELSFSPVLNDCFATFSFTPVFSTSSDTGTSTTVSISVGQAKNTPPKAEEITSDTYQNVYLEVTLKSEDEDGDKVIYQILDAPKLGTATIEGDTLKYTPIDGKKGTDKFTYVAIDTMGNSSEPAKITIQIRKNSAKKTYADMEKDGAHLPALKLSQLGVITGEKIGDNYFFNPASTLTRSEFIAMAVEAAGIKTEKTLKTDFADDCLIESWAKPYASAAASAKIIAGSPNAEGGATVFNGNQPITVAEASVILSNMTNLSTISTSNFDLYDYVPTWAQSATATLSDNGIIKKDENGKVNPQQNLTRSDACKMLYASLDHLS